MIGLIGHVEGGHGVNLLVIVPVAVAAIVYLFAWKRHSSRSWLRLGCWGGGLAALAVASSPWMEHLAVGSFAGHMVQHLVMIVVAAPLLVTAEPVRTMGRAVHLPTTPALRRLGRWWHRLSPALGPAVFVVVLFATHLTTWYDRSLHDRLLHDAEHGAYLFGATLTWAAVRGVGRTGAPARLAGVFGVSAASALLGMILMSASEPLMPTYEALLGSADALSDQRAAAAIMWVGGMVATVPLLLLAGWRWAAAEERVTLRAEQLADTRNTSANQQPDRHLSRPG